MTCKSRPPASHAPDCIKTVTIAKMIDREFGCHSKQQLIQRNRVAAGERGVTADRLAWRLLVQGRLQHADVRQRAVRLVEIETVPDHKLVWTLRPAEDVVSRHAAAGMTGQQGLGNC